MKPLTRKTLKGTWGSLLLPFGEKDVIDFSRLADQVDRLMAGRLEGLYCNGTACEFFNQTEEEFDRIAGLMAAKCTTARVPFMIGVSHMSPVISLNRLRRTRPLEPSAFQVILPDWYPTRPADRIDFLNRMAEAAEGIGLMLYNPGHAKVTLDAGDLETLAAAVPSIIGVKGVLDPDLLRRNTGLAVFVPGNKLATGLKKGAAGSCSNMACLQPAAAQRWYETMTTDMESALELEQRAQRFISELIMPYIREGGYCDAAVDKFMACLGGWADISPRLRWPYQSIPDGEIARLRPAARALLPEFFPDA